MSYQLILDASMCILWIVTYTLCFISTIKYKYPALSPITQCIIAPFEFAVLGKFILQHTVFFDYIFIAYAYWTAVEIGLMILVAIYSPALKGKKLVAYVCACIAMTALMLYLVAYRDQMYFFSYFNTFIGEIFWLLYILKKTYPMKPINLTLFLTKFVADAISIPVYLGEGSWISRALCVTLPCLDLCFIIVYLLRRKSSASSGVNG